MRASELMQQHARSIALAGFGLEGVQRLAGAHLLVVGAGGLGCAVLPQLVSQGIGRLTLYDADRVERSNLPRQLLYGPADVGRLKVEAARDRLMHLNADLRLDCRAERFEGEPAPMPEGGWDLLLDCTDNFATRYALDAYADRMGIPLLWGAVHDFAGQVSLLHGGAGLSLRDLFGEPEGPVPLSPGVFVPLVQAIGAIMASEAVRFLLGMPGGLDGVLLQLDCRDYSLMKFPISVAPRAGEECTEGGAAG